ncbi:hypothetical protein TNCV_1929941 [Trichonephila clavipes]|nr:hypothetical protein TNCV_1929941 [Trichonephila clavipes]
MEDGRNDLHVLGRGTLSCQWYRDEILALYVRIFRGVYGANFILMDNNTRPPRANSFSWRIFNNCSCLRYSLALINVTPWALSCSLKTSFNGD